MIQVVSSYNSHWETSFLASVLSWQKWQTPKGAIWSKYFDILSTFITLHRISKPSLTLCNDPQFLDFTDLGSKEAKDMRLILSSAPQPWLRHGSTELLIFFLWHWHVQMYLLYTYRANKIRLCFCKQFAIFRIPYDAGMIRIWKLRINVSGSFWTGNVAQQ